MKYTKLLIISLMLSISYTQTIDGVAISNIDSDYIMLLGYKALMSNKVSISVDYGQDAAAKIFGAGKMVIRDQNNKVVKFNSMMGAVNFFSNHGFDFVNAYAISTGNQNVYHFIMNKRK